MQEQGGEVSDATLNKDGAGVKYRDQITHWPVL